MENFTRIQRKDGMWNFLKPDGSFLSARWFLTAWDFCEGFARVQRVDGMENFLKSDGSFLC